jgi:phenylacetate-CoA ligase
MVNNLDTLELQVEVDEAFFQDKISQLQTLRQKIQTSLESTLGLGIKVNLVEPKTLERSEGKSKRVLDKRKF